MTSLHNLVNPQSRTGRGGHPSIWRGVVVNITANAVWVRVPTLAQDDLTATNTVPGDIAPGDRVIIAAVEGRVETLVILAKESPSIPAHTHVDDDIRYPGWGALTLDPAWTPGPAAEFAGLRYRVDSRFIHLHGTIIGTDAGRVTTLPVAPLYSSRMLALNTANEAVALDLTTTGALMASTGGTIRVNASAPLA